MTDLKKLIPGADHPLTVSPTSQRVTVRVGDTVVADTEHALTLQEASYPPVQYVPLADVTPGALEPSDRTSWCPYKGRASYYSLRVGEDLLADSVWTYPQPHDAVAAVEGHVAFYPDRVEVVAT